MRNFASVRITYIVKIFQSEERSQYAELHIVCFAFGCVLLFDLFIVTNWKPRKWLSFTAYSHACHMNTSERLKGSHYPFPTTCPFLTLV